MTRDAGDQRDLSFHPTVNPHPRTLTPEQIERFNREGFLFPFRVFDDDETLANRRYFDRLLGQVTSDGRDSYSINGFHARCAALWDLCREPRIVDLVEDLLGPNLVAWGTHYFAKLPGDGRAVSWHQDASYWPLTPAKTVTVWLAIDDSDRGNAAMKVLPGTHALGHLTFRESAPEEHNVLNQTVVDAEQFGEPVYLELRAGEISLHSDMLVHGSDPNVSTRRRCGLTIRYASTDVVDLAGWRANAIRVRGDDPDGQWGNIPRPADDGV
ncbi:MAG: phytanoyl-CoA dioxygenase family protein [Armatimonadetes bacterium]|nr:phytanoyl-CoA dioxygenase family protein [Armatimonadota bacterium]